MTFLIVLALGAPLVAAVYLCRTEGASLASPAGSQGFDSSNFTGGGSCHSTGGGGCDFGGGGDCSG
jgi:hypothetical protein